MSEMKNLLEELKTLRRENDRLSRELAQVRKSAYALLLSSPYARELRNNVTSNKYSAKDFTET